MSLSFHRLIDELIPRSKCEPSISHDHFLRDVIQQWTYLYSDFEADGHTCPCGARIKELCYIRNVETEEELYVGNDCIIQFGSYIKDVAEVARSLRAGLEMTMVEECCNHYHFRLGPHTSNVVKLDAGVREHFGGRSPLYREDGHYMIRMEKPQDKEKLVELDFDVPYRIVSQLCRHPRKPEKVLYVFYALWEDAERIRGEEPFIPPPPLEEEEEEESEEEEEEEDEEDDSCSEEESYEENDIVIDMSKPMEEIDYEDSSSSSSFEGLKSKKKRVRPCGIN